MAPAQAAAAAGPTSDGQSTSVPYALIPFLAILGAIGALLIFWAFARLLSDTEAGFKHFPDTQMQYMREVRQRNRQDIADLFSHRGQQYPPRFSHQISQDDSRMGSQYQ